MILLADSEGPNHCADAQDDLDLRCRRIYMLEDTFSHAAALFIQCLTFLEWSGTCYCTFFLSYYCRQILMTAIVQAGVISWLHCIMLTVLLTIHLQVLVCTCIKFGRVIIVCVCVRARACVGFYVYSFSKNFTYSQCQKTYLPTSAPSKDSDQPAHSICLIRIFVVRILDSQGCEMSSCGQRKLWSDSAAAQADLSLFWAHMSEGTFSHGVAHII